LIPRTVPAAAAAVRKKHQCFRLINDRQMTVKHRAARWNLDLLHALHLERIRFG